MSINPQAGPVPSHADPPYPATRPGPVRARVRRLRQDGGTYRAIAAAAVLAVTSNSIPRSRVDAGGARLRLRALHVMGHGSARIARALGVREMTIRQIVRGDARTVSLKLRDAIAELYDTWWAKRAPARRGGTADDQRSPGHPRPHPRSSRRAGTPRLLPRR